MTSLMWDSGQGLDYSDQKETKSNKLKNKKLNI
jgi:hypothetical protein